MWPVKLSLLVKKWKDALGLKDHEDLFGDLSDSTYTFESDDYYDDEVQNNKQIKIKRFWCICV